MTTESTTESTTDPSAATDARTDAGTDAGTDARTDGGAGSTADARPSRTERLEAEGDVAADYLEELLDVVDLDGDLVIGVEGDRAVVSIVGDGLGHLAGSDGRVLDALQELARLAVHRETGERSRLMLDVADYRADRRTALEALAASQVEAVRASGASVSLDPMSAFERKVVHDAVAQAGLVSESEGVEPRRHVVILPS